MKNNKRSLLLSITALILCCALLAGTTLAWFTDNASTAVNKIQAGTLDVDLVDADGNSLVGQALAWKKAAGHEGEPVLWEPGVTYELPDVYVVNKGNLALKYTIFVNGVQGSATLLEAIDFTVTVGGTTTTLDSLNGMLYPAGNTGDKSGAIVISGHMKETAGNEYQGLELDAIAITVNATQAEYEYDSFGNDYDGNSVTPIASSTVGNLSVTLGSVQNDATVSGDQTVADDVMTVSYPGGVKLDQTKEITNDNKTSITQKLEYKGDSLSDAATTHNVSIGVGQMVAQYELTLPVSQSNTTPVSIAIKYATNLTNVKVYHSGILLTETANSNGESATYDPTTGELTLVLKHASPIDIVHNATVPSNATIVYTLDELEAAVENLHDGDYIAFGANIVQDKVDTTSGQITFARASDAEGAIEATLDLNGCVFDGQIGGFSSENEGITVNVIGTEKAVAEYYKHQTGNHMVKACAVFNYSGKTVLKDGLFESNNAVVMAYGGNVTVQGGTLHNNSTEPGGCVFYACNDPKVTIYGGSFSCENGGTIFEIEPYRENMGPEIIINGGTFDASKGACFLYVDSDDSNEMASITINGGTFTMPTTDGDWAQNEGGRLTAGSNRIIIRGGTFNVDPSDYVDTANYNVTSNGSTWTVTAK